ncbi:MAG: 16S rRNA methyltransferase [Thermoproteota archaeon]
MFDSALELVPKELRIHPVILTDSKKRGVLSERIVLDRAIHHFAMHGLENSERRGRPDIVHTTLLVATDSPAYRSGYMRVFVHTYDGKILIFRRGVRPPVNYNNFVKLMAQLLQSGRVPLSGKTLIEMSEGSLKSLLKPTDSFVILLTSRGRKVDLRDVFKKVDRGEVTVLIGGYPKGPPRGELFELCDDAISIYDGVLASWTVTSRVIYELERLLPNF